MPKKLLKKGELHLTDIKTTGLVTTPPYMVSLEEWQAGETYQPEKIGVLIQADTRIEALDSLKPGFDFIGIQFNSFSDGRGFSFASQIRSILHFEGDIRACGELIADQIALLFKCGFSSIELPESLDEMQISEFVTPFSESYQSHLQSPAPLYQRVNR